MTSYFCGINALWPRRMHWNCGFSRGVLLVSKKRPKNPPPKTFHLKYWRWLNIESHFLRKNCSKRSTRVQIDGPVSGDAKILFLVRKWLLKVGGDSSLLKAFIQLHTKLQCVSCSQWEFFFVLSLYSVPFFLTTSNPGPNFKASL